jgi:hypothetical protein
MDFIVGVISRGPKSSNSKIFRDWGSKISQKDSWNPADIWLVRKGPQYTKMLKEIDDAETVIRINEVLKVAFHQQVIVGISLKQSSGRPGDLKYDLVNLQTKLKSLPEVVFSHFHLDLPFSERTGTFEKVTNEAFVNDGSGKLVGKMRIGSNQSSPQSNITFEFKGAGNVTAMLGKIPKDLMLQRLQRVIKIDDLPNWKDVRDVMPKSNTDKAAKHWKERVKLIVKHKKYFTYGSGFKPENFLNDLLRASNNDNMDTFINADCQIMETAYVFCQVIESKGKKGLDAFVMDMFYFAQKKGGIFDSEFGPFAKLH